MMSTYDVVVVGGGVAGLAVAAALAGKVRTALVEREPILAGQASGRNAAIYRPLEAEASTAGLAARSLRWAQELAERPLLVSRGLVLGYGSNQAAATEAARARSQGIEFQLLDRCALEEAIPVLRGGEVAAGLWLTEGGVLDIHELTSALARTARRQGVVMHTGSAVAEILTNGTRIQGIRLRDGSIWKCQHVVLAAGAWSARLAASVGASLRLQPIRRHLVQLGGSAMDRVAPDAVRSLVCSPSWPVFWRQDVQTYFRPEGQGLLASACDETTFDAEVPREPVPDNTVLDELALRLQRTAPSLRGLPVQRVWACFRTFAADRELVLGPDPRLAGLHWCAGLGGRGMTVGAAAGELVAQALLGQVAATDLATFAVARLLR